MPRDTMRSFDTPTMTALLSQRREPGGPQMPPMAEMAARDPSDDDDDAAWAFSEADQRSLLTLGLVAALALVLIAASGLLNFLA